MPNPSLVIVTKDFPPVRATHGRLAFDLAHRMSSEGYQVSVITSGDNASVVTEDNIHIYTVPEFCQSWRMKRLARKIIKADLVVSLTQKSSLLYVANYLAKKCGAKHVQWVQEMHPEISKALKETNLLNRIFNSPRKYLKAQKKCDLFVVPGRMMQRQLSNHHILPQKTTYIPNWTNLHGLHLEDTSLSGQEVTHSDATPKTIRRDDSPKFRIIHAGNLGKAYPVMPIVKAAELLKSHTEIEFIFVGDGHAHSQLAKERDKRELNNIRFIPYQPTHNYQQILESGDLHLVSLRREFDKLLVPCKFYSSLMVGRPVIYLGAAESEIGQVIKDFSCGEVIETMQPEDLVDVILKYRHDGQAWFAAQEGALNAVQQYNVTNSLDQWVKFLNEAL